MPKGIEEVTIFPVLVSRDLTDDTMAFKTRHSFPNQNTSEFTIPIRKDNNVKIIGELPSKNTSYAKMNYELDKKYFRTTYDAFETIRTIPIEIDTHLNNFGKEPWEVEYGEGCSICKSRIDEYFFCSCGVGGE